MGGAIVGSKDLLSVVGGWGFGGGWVGVGAGEGRRWGPVGGWGRGGLGCGGGGVWSTGVRS
jgi:hypothetical protein